MTAGKLLAASRTFLSDIGGLIPERFLVSLGTPTRERDLEPRSLPCLRHLDRIAGLAPPQAKAVVHELLQGRNEFCWGQTYSAADFGQGFLDNYGWLEILGTRGHFVHEEIAAGFLILGPHLLYPDHHHTAEEVYIPLTGGTEWRMGNGGFVRRDAGEVIHHPSNTSHAMRTGEEPLLAIYLWRGGPLAQKSVIDAASKGS
jgi:mannose-6-phosphate isomerase-like protein (cupin superfamily)